MLRSPTARRRLPVRASTLGWAGIWLGLAVTVQAARLAPRPIGPAASTVLTSATLPCLVLLGLATAGVVLTLCALRSRGEIASEEEPLLPKPRLPQCRQRSPLIGLVDLEPQAGASTLTFNLAVLVAVEGLVSVDGAETARPRPLCLLSDGPLAERLGVGSEPMRHHLERNSGRIAEDLIDIAVRHPSGCEVLCLPPGRVGRHQLRLIRQALARHYELVLVDCTTGDLDLREGAQDTADVLLGVGLPTVRWGADTTEFLGESLVRKRWPTTALLVNQLRGGQRRDPLAGDEFENLGALPYDAAVGRADQAGLPWSLLPLSPAAAALRHIAMQLLPRLMGEERNAVA